MGKASSIARLHAKKALKQPRAWLFVIAMTIYLDFTLGGFRSFLSAFDVNISLWGLIALMLSDADVQGCLMILFALTLCDLPGWDESEPYILLRSGRDAWVRGKLLSLAWIIAAFFVLLITLTAALVWRISPENAWGPALITLSETNAGQVYGIAMSFSRKVMGLYEPLTAFGLSLLLSAGFCFFSGLWALLLNFITNRPVGSIVIVGFALLGQAIGGLMVSGNFYRVSPASLCSLAVIGAGYWPERPTLFYSASFYLVGSAPPLLIMLGAANRVTFKTLSS